MNSSARALISLMSIVTLLAFVCLAWTMPQAANAVSRAHASKTHQLFCSGPTASAGYLAEIKPRISAIGSAIIAAIECSMFGLLGQSNDFDGAFLSAEPQALSRPLWLVNRALLI